MKVELIHVTRIIGGKIILNIEKLELESGKIYAVLGPNGSGKTTMLRILAGIDSEWEGQVRYNGIGKIPGKGIAYMPQSSYLFDMTVMDNILLGLKDGDIPRSTAVNLAESALNQVGMESFKNMKARSLSGGEAQKVALARTLVLGKSLVLLDEPASATDIMGMERVEQYIQATCKKDKSTIVFTTHNPSQAARIADEVVFMHCGRLIEKGSPSSVFNTPRERETGDFLKYWRL